MEWISEPNMENKDSSLITPNKDNCLIVICGRHNYDPCTCLAFFINPCMVLF